jgi:hypothetical protein
VRRREREREREGEEGEVGKNGERGEGRGREEGEYKLIDCRRSLKDALELPESTIVGYQSHADSMKKSYTKNRYEV